MGIFDRLFGKKRGPDPEDEDRVYEDEEIRFTDSQPIQGPPDFVHAAQMQRAYWTHNAKEQAELEARGVDDLGWRDLLRLHHLICLQRLGPETERAAATEKCRRTLRRLLAAESPYRSRAAVIWQGQPTQPDADREPDMQGEFVNPSLTHLGCLEVYRLDPKGRPARIDFVGFDELSGVLFAPPKLLRAAKLFFEDGQSEIVLVPLLYGLTWIIGSEHHRSGEMTGFVAHLEGEAVSWLGAPGIGVGQQDLTLRTQAEGARLFGLGSVAEMSFPLDMRDPRFDEKARARGIDPDEVRKRANSL